jgi:hypothetical protein
LYITELLFNTKLLLLLPSFESSLFCSFCFPLASRSGGAGCHAVAAAQAMRLHDTEWNGGGINAALRAYRKTASAADTGVRDEKPVRPFLSAAEGEGGPFDRFL